MDCEISANGNKLSPCLHKDTELESPYNGLCAGIAITTYIISQRVKWVNNQGQRQLKQELLRNSLMLRYKGLLQRLSLAWKNET